jgi:hypothetical protein
LFLHTAVWRKINPVPTLFSFGYGMAVQLLEGIPLLQINQAAASLASQLVSKRMIPASAGSDAVHIAVASVHATDFLVTWNFRHIANPFLRDRLRRAVADFGAVLPVICTPEELLQDHEND